MADRDLGEELRKAKAAEAAREFAENKAEAQSTVNRVLFEANGIRKFLWQVATVFFWIWKNLLWPFSIWMSPIAVWAFRKYKDFWTDFTVQKDKFDVPRFSKKRGVTLALGTIFAAVFTFHLAFFIMDAAIFGISKHQQDVIYLYRSEDSFDNDGIYSVSGCEISDPALKAEVLENLTQALVDVKTIDLACKDVDGLYFRVSFSWFDWFYRLVTKGQFFYYPDLVHASIATNWNVCITDNYGYRWRWLMGLKIEQFYPKLLVTECHSISQ